MNKNELYSDNLIELSEESKFNEHVKKNLPHFNDFFKRHIQFQRKIKHDFNSMLKDHSLINSAGLPKELSEQFIHFEKAPWFWAFPTAILDSLYKIYNITPKRLIKSNPQRVIFDFYLRWASSINQNDSKYFALSIIKQIKNSRKNALNLLLHGTILAYEKSVYNPESALIQFEESENLLIAKELDEMDSLQLKYVIRLFKAFVKIKLGEYEEAKCLLEEALNFKDDGISALFHLVIVNLHLGEPDIALDYAKKVYQFELDSMIFALRKNDLVLFELFLENSISSNYFSDKYSTDLLIIFESSLNDLVSSGQLRFDKLKEDMLTLKEFKWYKENGDLIKENVNLIDDYLKHFSHSENIFVLESITTIEDKFVESINCVLKKIESDLQESVSHQLRIYDIKIAEDEDLKKRLVADLEKSKERLETKREQTLIIFSESMDEKIKIADERVKNIEFLSELNPTTSFKNSMMYSVLLSVLVLMLGGFAEYSNGLASNGNGLGRVISVVIVGGSKWGILTFIVGMLVALVMSVSTSFEKTKVKQRLSRDISTLKDEKQNGIKRINEESKETIKLMEERTNKKIESFDKQIQELKDKKLLDQKHLMENVNSRLKSETIKLTELIENY